MKARYVIIGLLLLGLAIRLHPPLAQGSPVNFDSTYHARIAQSVAETGWVPSWDYAAGGRPHLYPPLYHLLLGYSSAASGIPAMELTGFVLPLVSALLALTAFFLVRRHRGEGTAIWAAAFAAMNPIIIAQSYDSPQLFGLLLFPLIAYFFLKGRYLPGGGLLAVCLLFNYFVALTIAAVLVVFGLVRLLRGGRLPIICGALIIGLGLGLASPWLLVSLDRAGQCFDPSTAVSAITGAGQEYLLLMAPFVALLGFGLLYWLRERDDDYTLFWRIALALGTVGFLVSLVVPQLHPYDQLLLFGFSLIFVLPELGLKRKHGLAVIAVMAAGGLLAVLSVSPALSEGDMSAAEWVAGNVRSGTVLANPEVSATINALAMSPQIRTEFDLFLECIPDSERWGRMYSALRTEDVAEARETLEAYGVDYVVVGARDVWNYGFDIEKFGEMGEAVFSSGETTVYMMDSEK